MDATGLLKYAAAVVTLAVCSACGGALRQAQDDMSVAPSTGAPNVRYTTALPNLRPLPRYAMIVPDRRPTSKSDFEYIISDYDSYASIFDYPKSDQQIGSIKDVGGQGCTNVLYGYGRKIFWIVAAESDIAKYAVPDTQIKTLSVSEGAPSSCAMDRGGALAVGILYGSGGGDVVIFKHESGPGTVYSTPLAEEFFDGYDNHGNLFADGFINTNRSGFELIELAKGSSKFVPITTSNTVQFPGSVQWDGTYLTVFDQLANATYQYTISGTTATLEGTVRLSGSSDCAQTWIVKGLLYCADAGNEGAEVFNYPAGGSPIAVFTGNFDLPLGVTAAKQ